MPKTVVERTGVPRNRSDQPLTGAQQLRAQVDVRIPQPDDPALVSPVVEISSVKSIKRLGIGWCRWFAEGIYSPSGNEVVFRYEGSAHLLVLYHEGARRGGETTIDGLTPSRARRFANKITFVPAGYAYREQHETCVSTRMTFLYIDPENLLTSNGASIHYMPRIYSDDPIVCETAAKMRNAVESGEKNTPYLDALSNVLAHELSRPEGAARSNTLNRGGLASWQEQAAIRHIEDHLSEKVCLKTLAKLVRLSAHHFCRSFKQSFGVPPHQYHVQRRMESAKVLLAARKTSVTEIALMLGYSQTSSFSAAFRKTTGWTPRAYRREFP